MSTIDDMRCTVRDLTVKYEKMIKENEEMKLQLKRDVEIGKHYVVDPRNKELTEECNKLITKLEDMKKLSEKMNTKIENIFKIMIGPKQELIKDANSDFILDVIMNFVETKKEQDAKLQPISTELPHSSDPGLTTITPTLLQVSMERFMVHQSEIRQDKGLMKVTWIFSDKTLYTEHALKKVENDIKVIYPKLTINCSDSPLTLSPCDKVVLFFFISSTREYTTPIKQVIQQIKNGYPNASIDLVMLRDIRSSPSELALGNVDIKSKETFDIYTGLTNVPMGLAFEKPKTYKPETFDKVVDNYQKIKEHLKKLHN